MWVHPVRSDWVRCQECREEALADEAEDAAGDEEPAPGEERSGASTATPGGPGYDEDEVGWRPSRTQGQLR